MNSTENTVSNNSSSVTPTKSNNMEYVTNMSDPINARIKENKLTLKNSQLWRRRNKRVYPMSSK